MPEEEEEVPAQAPAEGESAGTGDDAGTVPAPRRSLRARRGPTHDAAAASREEAETKPGRSGKAQEKRQRAVPTELGYSDEVPLKDALRELLAGRPEGTTATVDVRVPGVAFLPPSARSRGPLLYGTDRYLDESDLVAVLMHCGYYSSGIATPPPFLKDVVVTLRVFRQGSAVGPSFVASTRNNVRSSSWGEGQGVCFEVLKCVAQGVSGAEAELRPNLTGSAVFSTVIPTVTERLVNTRSSAVGNAKKQRFQKEVTLTYNLCNEPWHKYSVAQISDRGLEKHHWTSARLHSEVLFIEGPSKRYEISLSVPEAGECNGPVEGYSEPLMYQFAECGRALSMAEMHDQGVPLPEAARTVIAEGVAWREFLWGPSGLELRGAFYPLARAHFMKRTHNADGEMQESESESESDSESDSDEEGEGEGGAGGIEEAGKSQEAAGSDEGDMEEDAEKASAEDGGGEGEDDDEDAEEDDEDGGGELGSGGGGGSAGGGNDGGGGLAALEGMLEAAEQIEEGDEE